MQHFKTTSVKRTISTILFLFLSTLIYSQNSKTKIEENRFIERRDNKFGITDSLRNVIIPFKYDFIEFKNQRLIIRNNNLNGLSPLALVCSPPWLPLALVCPRSLALDCIECLLKFKDKW